MEANRFYRSRENKMIGGVCSGLGKYFKIDLVLVRLIFVLGMFFSCIFPFFLLYIALWIATPLEPKEPVIDGYQPKDGLDTSNPPVQN